MQAQSSTGLSRHERATGGKATFSIDEFCEAHNISRSTFYNLQKIGKGPRLMTVLNRRLISAEAAADWRVAMETT